MSTAVIYRMVMPEHICPFGLKAKDFLEREGFEVEDHRLKSRAETDEFKRSHGVEATPHIFVEGQRIGGYDDLRRHFGRHVPSPDETSYRPVIAIFAVAPLMAVAMVAWAGNDLFSVPTIEKFIAISMCLLGVQKLQDVESFSTMFLGYDLLSQRWVRYAYIYPFAETIAGILMLSGALVWVAAPLSILIGLEGVISIFKAVYIDRKELKCACVGGNSKVPLGMVSITESALMAAMGAWMLLSRYSF